MKRQRDAIASACGWCSTIAIAVGCSGAQQGYYSSCDEPTGVVLGCEQPPPIEDFTAWDACDKLVRCGIVPMVTSRIEGRVYAVVSVHAFEGIDPARIRRAPASFEGEGTGDRLARRQRNWIPDVSFRPV